MRSVLLLLVFLLAPMPAIAQSAIYSVPMSIPSGEIDVRTEPFGTYSLPASFPVELESNCSGSFGTVTVEEVSGGIEVEVDAATIGVGCRLQAQFIAAIEITVPELGATSTLVWSATPILLQDFSSIGTINFEFGQPQFGTTSSSIDGPVPLDLLSSKFIFAGGDVVAGATNPRSLIPGDTVTYPARFEIQFDYTTAPTIGTLRVRYELKTKYVPEPSAALSLPIGVLTLAGLSMLKGGA